MTTAEPVASRITKRRAGVAMGGLPVADPRPVWADGAVLGVRCTACRYPAAQQEIPWCPVCHAAVAPERFSPLGTVWSTTVVAIPVGERRPPFALAYLDLDDGPRLLVHMATPDAPPIGSRARLTGTDGGDLVAVTEGSAR
jgi:uncharacterized OB-fold protein